MPIPKGVSEKKFHRCVEKVKKRKGAKSAYAICYSSMSKRKTK